MTWRSSSATMTNSRRIEADTASFTYARLQRMREDMPTGYDEPALDRFETKARALGRRRPRQLRLHDQRRQGARAGRGAGVAGAASLIARRHAHRPSSPSAWPCSRPTAAWARRSRKRRSEDGGFKIDADHGDVSSISRRPPRLQASLDRAVGAGVPILIGTTGLDDLAGKRIEQAAREIAVLRAPNTSLGSRCWPTWSSARRACSATDWDIEIVEMHHRMKADAPSGTALALGEAAARGRGDRAEDERGRDRHRPHARTGRDRLRGAARRHGARAIMT